MQFGEILNQLHLFSHWLDTNMPDEYRNNPLALKWLRTAKVGEESGEVIDALIALTGGNPRKTERGTHRHLYDELADSALTAILSLLHHVDNPAIVGAIIVERVRLYLSRMTLAKGKRPTTFMAHDLWIWDEQAQYNAWISSLISRMPPCWDDDTAIESIIRGYIANLEDRHSMHTAACDENNNGC